MGDGFDGERCEINECLDYNCNHGNCYIDGGDPTCECYPGWKGEDCSEQGEDKTSTNNPVKTTTEEVKPTTTEENKPTTTQADKPTTTEENKPTTTEEDKPTTTEEVAPTTTEEGATATSKRTFFPQPTTTEE